MEGITISALTSSFAGCVALVKVENINSAGVTSFRNMFYGCTTIETIPEFDTSKATDVSSMFSDCTALVNLPTYSFAKISNLTKVNGTFSGCPNLSNTSLNNIIKTLLTLGNTSFGTKSLKYVGLSETQATTCTSFDEWTELAAKGWTTGY